MAITNLFSVRDCKAGFFQRIFQAHNPADASRSLQIAMESQESMIRRFPQDFDLYMLGEFNDTDGKITLQPQPVLICNCQQLVEKKQ